MGTHYQFSLWSIAFSLCTWLGRGWSKNLTHGFIELPFNTSFYHIQKPYDLPVEQRYSFINGVHKLWVFSTDKPLYRSSPTKPRSEISISGYTYSSGVWQFEAYGYVTCGTSIVSIMQVFGATLPYHTSFILGVDTNGSLTYFKEPVIYPKAYDKWFRLNVIHEVETRKLKVYINGIFKYETLDRGGTSHYFKCGVYAGPNPSYYMESRWKGIRIFKKFD
ncbi:Citrate-binding protein [Olea europaea subsp. europaea]|uniref:Citrate-binding protein n=1 Tax=Olea europaea subsp. europaea TaxID=158383 RepID=A0A8S0VFS9_OLEEU|nr:Citrate-binding protein [Olea europaea subsp. europaea]